MTAARTGLAAAGLLLSTGIAVARPAEDAPLPARHRVRDLGPAPRGVPEDDPIMRWQRQTVRPEGVTTAAFRGESRTLSYDAQPRSRTTLLRFEDRIALDERLAATIGWRGMKISNRNANVALDGRATRLRARDWFLPHAAIAYQSTPRLALSLGYRETMRGFEGAGTIGPFGLTRAGFDALRSTLRPERAHLLRMDGQWHLRDVRLSLAGFQGSLRDPLDLSSRSYRPGNGASLALFGIAIAAEQTLGSRLVWSVRYQRADGSAAGARGLREDEIGILASWSDGPWRGSFGAARAGSTMLDRQPSAVPTIRIEAAIDRTMNGPAGRPLRLSARLIDPTRLASMRAMEESGAARAGDRARRVMVQATMVW